MNQKIAVEWIKIEVWGGDPDPGDFQPAKVDIITGEKSDHGWGIFEDWIAAGQYLRKLALKAPIGGGYDKRDFSILFEDKEKYSGRLDVQHLTMPYPDNDNDLAAHVWLHVTFYTGERKPDHMDEEQYTGYLAALENKEPGHRQNAIDFLKAYDIPENDGLTPDDDLTYCQKCGATFIINSGPLCGRCKTEKEEREAAEAERSKELAEAKADPLYGIRDRTQVTKTMRSLLKKRSGKAWSVTGGRGTGWGWLTITAPPSRRSGDYDYMTPADCRELALLLGEHKPIHPQGESVRSGDWFAYLKACRGDFSTPDNDWREFYSILPEHDCYIMNKCAEGPKTAGELLEGWKEYAKTIAGNGYTPDLHRIGLDHDLYFLTYTGELYQAGDRYTTEKPEQAPAGPTAEEPEPAPTAEEPEPAPTAEEPEPAPTAEVLPHDGQVNHFSRPAGWGWIWAYGFEREWSWLAIEDDPDPGDAIALGALGFRWSKKRRAFYAPRLIDRAIVAEALHVD